MRTNRMTAKVILFVRIEPLLLGNYLDSASLCMLGLWHSEG